ncbi:MULTISPECIES: PTS glucose transporter subunit IIA [unclassified Pseudoalteromonas]|uniref:PTS glucose transporter subunit IIA n=1 Tax=unclassified Pseudoalteromonas TaxID=194690 RepID=UPI000B63F8DC|nr:MULTISPECIES: PTS glucose transporter subunit IIA [unclassified Pseudoalteromonas]MAJ40512.1 PTS sugar transporter [Pseudoalteromonadaceae bacterium]OUX87004.1 MAG: PTS sugar transporter [Pseudoalteromonas sp. TMED43]MDC9564472.1 PTS glucose transporter subunit IIA [Pseudoalteromonas sp. GAB2316C]MDC9568951.1 PTS glucose transporter subunit IIA [Pseudoalteromonas sp. GABNB9D]MDC9573120.1 PTS glucose transporter subunit IIA [Pseudoalteromonas sp. GABNS16A]|tara:strand:- start:2901 stop:3398 length:498 start_codon:yes stop_codon:yes gene_type:complete
MRAASIEFLAQNKLPASALKITSPFSGKIIDLNLHPEPFFKFSTLGPTMLVALSNHKILAPFDGTLLQVKNAGCEFILQANNGLKVLINLSLPAQQPITHTHIAQLNGSKISKGQRLAYFDLRELKSPLLASLVLLNGHNLGTFHYSHTRVNAGVDPLLTIIKKN